jgi:hypothetical protein
MKTRLKKQRKDNPRRKVPFASFKAFFKEIPLFTKHKQAIQKSKIWGERPTLFFNASFLLFPLKKVSLPAPLPNTVNHLKNY